MDDHFSELMENTMAAVIFAVAMACASMLLVIGYQGLFAKQQADKNTRAFIQDPASYETPSGDLLDHDVYTGGGSKDPVTGFALYGYGKGNFVSVEYVTLAGMFAEIQDLDPQIQYVIIGDLDPNSPTYDPTNTIRFSNIPSQANRPRAYVSKWVTEELMNISYYVKEGQFSTIYTKIKKSGAVNSFVPKTVCKKTYIMDSLNEKVEGIQYTEA